MAPELSKETVTLSGPSTEIGKVGDLHRPEETHKGEVTLISVTLDTALRFLYQERQ